MALLLNGWSLMHGRVDGHTDRKRRDPIVQGPARILAPGYAAADFFAPFGGVFATGFFPTFAFSLAANSCLTLGATCKAVRMIVRETRLVAHCFTGPVVPSAVLYEAMR